MPPDQSHIPNEVYLGFLGRTIEVHWNYHAILMAGIWLILVPICITVIRYGKPKPTEHGVRTKVSLWNREWWWFSIHKYGLYIAVLLSLCGLTVALVVSQGFSGSLHSILGVLTILMGCLQAVSGMLRGSHGGKFYYTAKPDDPASWRGDHYSRTIRRRIFEAYHKTAGYFAVLFAIGATGSGLMQYPMPIFASILLSLPFVFLAVWVVLEFLERRYDGYKAVHGYGLEHPYNKAREFL